VSEIIVWRLMPRLVAVALILITGLFLLTPAIAQKSGQKSAQKSGYPGAMGWYEREAAKGSAKAQFLLGLLYEQGAGKRAKNLTLAHRWFLKAAEQGYPRAQYKIATAYHFGTGIAADAERAVLWYRRAAGQGVAEAQHNLAHMLLNGTGTKRSPDEAARWYTENARHGFGPSQLALGYLYLQGTGVKADLAEAWAWFRAAESRGVDGAAKARVEAAQRLAPEDLKRAKILAKPRIRK
jgi:TPR repeat protein